MKILLCSWNCTSRLQNDRKDHKTLTLQIYSRTCTHGFWGQNNLHITTSFIPKNSLMYYSKGKKNKIALYHIHCQTLQHLLTAKIFVLVHRCVHFLLLNIKV